MDTPLQVSFRNMDRSDALEVKVRERVDRLERFFDHIISCRVVIEAPHRHHNKGKHYNVRVELAVPGKTLLVNRDPTSRQAHEDAHVALRDAFQAMQRQLQDYVRTLQGQVKAHEGPAQGRVSRLFAEEGYGFVLLPDGQEVYFHRNSVADDGFDDLAPGSEVQLAVSERESDKGPQATVVRPAGKLRPAG
jgi:ribosomal subunit interface protein